MNQIFIIMGVSGSGKTTIGQRLAAHLDLPFFDADDFHPKENIQKMADGIALTDDDRQPWLMKIAESIANQQSGVWTCSALKKEYRATIDPKEKFQWIFLDGPKELIRKRISERSDHFMTENLLDSQFETLQIPGNALTIDIRLSPEKIIQTILQKTHEA